MEFINVIVVDTQIIESMKTFPIHEKELESTVTAHAEEHFKTMCIQAGCDETEMDRYLEDGVFIEHIGGKSVMIIWSDDDTNDVIAANS